MGSITNEMVKTAYNLAREVHHLKKSEPYAVRQIDEMGMNPASARMYIENFSRMMVGECLTRTMNQASFQRYLSGIYADYGLDALRNALDATFAHVRYYESYGRGRLAGVEAIASACRRKHFPS